MCDNSALNITNNCSGYTTGRAAEYAMILEQYAFPCKKNGWYYVIGEIITEKYELFISVMVAQTSLLLHLLLPQLKITRTAFRLICNPEAQFRLNNGEFGLKEAGKVMIMYPKNKEEAIFISGWLKTQTAIFMGPNLGLYVHIGGNLYSGDRVRISKWSFFSFAKKRSGAILEFTSRRVIGKYYRPRILLRFSAKGEIHQGINMKSLEWCIIKRGRHCAFEDLHGRTIRDRLRWQAFLYFKIMQQAPLQPVIEYIEEDRDTYLVLQYMEGRMVGEKIAAINPDNLPFRQLAINQQKSLLQLFLQITISVRQLHDAGIVHRDINEGNLIAGTDNKIYIIDLEMAVDLNLGLPAIPFYPGASAYRAPEQSDRMPEGFGEDIYSLGCLLYFMLVGKHPENYSHLKAGQIANSLEAACDNRELVEVCLWCMEPNPGYRPAIDAMSNAISAILLVM